MYSIICQINGQLATDMSNDVVNDIGYMYLQTVWK